MSFHPDHSEGQMKTMQQGLLSQIEAIGWKGNVECSVSVEEEAAPKSTTNKDPVRGMSGGGMGPHGGPIQKQSIPGVKHIIAIASVKVALENPPFLSILQLP